MMFKNVFVVNQNSLIPSRLRGASIAFIFDLIILIKLNILLLASRANAIVWQDGY